MKKHQKDISEIDQKIISMYAKGLTTRQISEQIEEIYGFECSESFISDVTDKILQDIDDWQNRPLDEIYPIMFIDAVHFSVREDNRIKKLAAYVILAITLDGRKDVMIICADGLTGMKEAIGTAFPDTEYQRCIVHQVRNTLKYVPYKDMELSETQRSTIEDYIKEIGEDADFGNYSEFSVDLVIKEAKDDSSKPHQIYFCNDGEELEPIDSLKLDEEALYRDGKNAVKQILNLS